MHSLEHYIDTAIPAHQAPGIAFFDLDRTLIAGYSIIGMAWETARHGAAQGELRQSAKVVRDVLRHRVDESGGNYHRLVKRVARALTGVSDIIRHCSIVSSYFIA